MKAEAPYLDGITVNVVSYGFTTSMTLNPTGFDSRSLPRDSFSTETPFRFGDFVTLEVWGRGK